MLCLCVFLLCVSSAVSTNITYTNLTDANYTEIQDVNIDVPGLSHLFDMSRNFVNIVFVPFSTIEEFIFSLLRSSGSVSNTFLQDLVNDWQTLVSYEIGFLVCLIFGFLFIIFVPLVGLIMCCCRSCCSNCGGKMEQSPKRARSNWRHCFCCSLLIMSVFMAVPCIFVYLTNEWTGQALQNIPGVTNSAVNDLVNFINVIPQQLEHIVGEYDKLDASIEDDITNIGTSLGNPIRDEFMRFTMPVLNDLSTLSNDTKDAFAALEEVNTDTAQLDQGIADLNNALESQKAAMDSGLNNANCNASQFCQIVQSSTVALSPTGANFSSVDDIQQEIDSLNQTLNTYNIDEEINTIVGQVNEIPQTVVSSSQEATDKLSSTLNEINDTLAASLEDLPLEPINNLNATISDIGSIIEQSLSDYSDNYDVYRYAAGIVLASIIAVIVAFYWFGMAAGTLSFSAYPSDRSSFSNCGGICIMAAVGFSFIFAWLLMILVAIFFSIGGHGERYICQTLQAPYEGLRFADRVLASTSTTGGFNISLVNTIQNCELNKSIYEATELEKVYNVSELVQNTTEFISEFREDLADLSVDLSNINTYPPSVENALEDMKNSALDGVDFDSYLNEIGKGLTSRNLLEYAQFLNDSADNMTNFESALPGIAVEAERIRNYSYQITVIHRERVASLVDTHARLNASVNRLTEIASGFNASIESLQNSLQDLNQDIAQNGSEHVQDVTMRFADSLIGDVVGYMDYVLVQLTERFGACRPVFLVYAKMTNVLCSYLMDILNGFWFSLGWCVFFLMPSAIVGLKLAKFYRTMSEGKDSDDAHWNELEMEAMHQSNNNNARRPSSKLRSPKVHPEQYY